MGPAGYAGNALSAPTTDRAATLNERLNKVCDGLQYQCERIEGVLNRVQGNPTPIGNAVGGVNKAQVSPTLPLTTIVEHLEQVLSRAGEIASVAERIA